MLAKWTFKSQKKSLGLRSLLWLVISEFCLWGSGPIIAYGADFSVGLTLGLGGAGITTPVTVTGVKTTLTRVESPGVFALNLDYLMFENFRLGIEHARGFRVGPASSQVSFSGIYLRWYFLGPAPFPVTKVSEGATLMVRKIVPYVAGGSGVALAAVTRDGDIVPSVDGAGVFIGGRVGADYALSATTGVRTEVALAFTVNANSVNSVPVSLNYFAYHLSIYYYLF